MNVIKRNGSVVEFDLSKIAKALKLAFKASSQQIDENLILEIASQVKVWENISIEDIQDQIEELLQDYDFQDVYKEFSLYRRERALIREQHDSLMHDVGTKLNAQNVQNQNANVDEHSFGGRVGEAGRVVTKNYALNYCMSSMARNNHLNNEIYIHDLDSYAVGMHNCLSIPFDELLAQGFTTRQTDVRPANSLNTAFQLVAVLFQLQSLQQFGGVSATHLDWTMVPYFRKSFFKHYIVAALKNTEDFLNLDIISLVEDTYTDEVGIERNKFEDWIDENKQTLLKKLNLTIDDFRLSNKSLDKKYYQSALYDTIQELKQAVEGMYHNLNTLQSRSGNQLPFTSINYGTCTSEEGRLIIRALLMGSLKGVGLMRKTPIFPCGIFQLKKGINRNFGDPNYDLFQLALKSTSKRLYPNYANVNWTGNIGYDENDPRTYFSTMGCRTANGWDINGFDQLKDGRGNICPVTIIMPTLAMEANKDVEEFMSLLDIKIHEAKDMLIERFDWICSQDPSSAQFMYENGTMFGYIPEEGIRSALKHGTLAIGQLGLAETLQILIGEDHTSEKGMDLAKRIESLFKQRCAEFKEHYKLNFGVYYTPAENLCYTAMKKFQEKYGKLPKISDRDYFTNSIHVPVWHTCTPFEKIDIESQLTGYSSAGCITYIELPASTKHNTEALEIIVNYAMDHDIPYFAVNVPNDQCQHCGYVDEINDSCPMCGSKDIKRLRRVTGYLTGDYTKAFNKGKQDETEDRVKHIKTL